MKLAQIALIAVLTAPCAATAASIDNPGPHKVPKDQHACMNLMDADDVEVARLTKRGLRAYPLRGSTFHNQAYDRA